MALMLIIVLIIGFAGIIGNQYASLKRMDDLQRSVKEIEMQLRDLRNKEK
ncbi:hypothetical protein J25TS5_09450 [Paenibacillus faecis]|nr:hypothetical protein [Paenibacillus faecis]GIO84013.1 hypothetical protein J25TS5_09450 [Paenibacillus faecis]